VTVVGVVANTKKILGGGLEALRLTLAQHGVAEPLWREVPKARYVAGAVTELVAAGADLVFAWGGDGTVRRCLNAIGDAPVALAILPAGTANLFAGNLGIPRDLEQAVKVGLSGRRRRLDVGEVNGERFGVMAGVGFDAIMIRKADAGLKDRLGRWGYVVAGVGAVRGDAVPARVSVDGTLWFEGPLTCVLVGNMGNVLGGLPAFPNARPDDGLLDVGVVTAASVLDWANTLGFTMIGRPASSPFVRTTTAASIAVELEEPLPYEVDGGDRSMVSTLRFRVHPAAVEVCVP
jgi:YegS/Rv2252/BmrU family lipid kinase